MAASQFPLNKLGSIVRNRHQDWNCGKSEDTCDMLIRGLLNIIVSSLQSYVLNCRVNKHPVKGVV